MTLPNFFGWPPPASVRPPWYRLALLDFDLGFTNWHIRLGAETTR